MTDVHDIIERAIEGEIPVSFKYRPTDPDVPEEDIARRFVSPYEVSESSTGKDLLTCWSHGSEGVRRFDLARIYDVRSEAGNEDFVHPVERA